MQRGHGTNSQEVLTNTPFIRTCRASVPYWAARTRGKNRRRPSPCHLMLVHPDDAAAVTDALWARLRQEAEEAYDREPKLASLFFDSILNQPTFEAAVFHRVAARLKNDTISLPLIVQAFGKAAED